MLEHYEKRWLIEEFHKALKSGCRLEERQYEAAKRLEAVTGVLSVLAVRLLQLKTIARDEPQRPAKQVVPMRWIQMLQSLRKRPPKSPWTVRDFYRELAKLGGFLGRKSDGEPGWMTLWHGFEKLHLCLRGADAYARKCGVTLRSLGGRHGNTSGFAWSVSASGTIRAVTALPRASCRQAANVTAFQRPLAP